MKISDAQGEDGNDLQIEAYTVSVYVYLNNCSKNIPTHTMHGTASLILLSFLLIIFFNLLVFVT